MLKEIWQKCHSLSVRLKSFVVKNVGPASFTVLLLSVIFSAWLGFVVSSFHTGTQFRVVYSLDKKQNDQEIVKLINDADKYVYFAIYFFTKNEIASALIRAKKRGLVVWGITDAGASLDSNKNIVEELRSAGIAVEVQKRKEGIMHLKTVVTDKAYASGSYNWTKSATVSNDEILEIGTNESVRKQYLKIIQRLLVDNS